jgi:PilZ domain
MMEERERRMVSRTTLADRPAALVRGLPGVRLLDLSLTGAQIEHLDLLRPGAACTLDLLPPCGALSLPAQVVWCAVIGRKHKVGSASHLVARSGLRFTTLTRAQHAALADSLEHLAAAAQPNLDSHRGSA